MWELLVKVNFLPLQEKSYGEISICNSETYHLQGALTRCTCINYTENSWEQKDFQFLLENVLLGKVLMLGCHSITVPNLKCSAAHLKNKFPFGNKEKKFILKLQEDDRSSMRSVMYCGATSLLVKKT